MAREAKTRERERESERRGAGLAKDGRRGQTEAVGGRAGGGERRASAREPEGRRVNDSGAI